MSDRSLNLDRAVDEIITRAVEGLNATLKYAEDRARYYVPVRSIFVRGRRGGEYPRTLTPAGVSAATAMNIYRQHGMTTAAQHAQFKKSLAKVRRVNVPEPEIARPARDKRGTALDLREEVTYQRMLEASSTVGRGPRLGHANSETALIRHKGETTFGDLRRVKDGQLVPVAYFSQVRGGKVELKAAYDSDEAEASYELTARGRYEVKTGRATFHRAGADRVGGKLKHTIHVVPATLTSSRGGVIWGYVRAGGEMAPYARWQEFGSSHNRAHPFLRPALYESRKVLAEQVARGIRGGRFKRA